MKKLTSLWLVFVLVVLSIPVLAEESQTYKFGPEYSEQILNHQHIPYQMKNNLTPRYNSSSQNELDAFITYAVLHAEPSVTITYFIDKSYTKDQIENEIISCLLSLIANNPLVFYLDSCSIQTDTNTGLVRLFLEYSHSQAEILEFNNKTIEVANKICEEIMTGNQTPLQKEIAMHNYLIENCRYDMENYNANTIPVISHSAYGALVLGVAVCDGYARAFDLLMEKAAIPCIVLTSDEMLHAWNIVNIDGNNYHVDVTWDDVDVKCYKGNYEYFNIDDDALSVKPKRVWDKTAYPPCSSDYFSYIYNLKYSKQPQTDLDYFYFCDPDNSLKITKMDVHTGEKNVLSNNSTNYLALYESTLFYSNLSGGSFLHSVGTDGLNDEIVVKENAKNFYVENNVLHYTQTIDSMQVSKQIPLSVPLPTLYKSDVLALNSMGFYDKKENVMSAIYDYDTLTACVEFNNKSDGAVTFNILTVTYQGGILQNAEITPVKILAGESERKKIPISLKSVDNAKILILDDLEPITSSLSIFK